MRLEICIREIEQLAKQREDANWEFRCYLKGCGLSSSRIDAVVHRLCGEISREIDCTKCANCCKAIAPVLKPADILRLAKRLKLSSEEFRSRFLVHDLENDRLMLKGVPCPFLRDNLCTVYDDRPNNCRSYPHLHKKGFVFRLNQAFSNCSVCPIVFNVYEYLKLELWRR